ncbi:MAG: hypothetical protein RIB47_05605 [Cyclobacteriaceae bacterium]
MINYLFFIGIAFVLFLAFRVLRFVSYRVNFVRRSYPFVVAIELTLWIAFLFWVLHYFFRAKAYYNNLVLVLVVTAVILLVWFYIKDVVAGFIFRIRHNPRVGQLIQSTEAVGIVKLLAPSQIFIEEEGRNIVRIPYARLLGKSLSIDNPDTHSASEAVFRLKISAEVDRTNLEDKIKVSLLQSPWGVPGKPIRVSFPPDSEHTLEVSLHLIDKSYTEVVKGRLKTLLH